jgi:hypothetical protein
MVFLKLHATEAGRDRLRGSKEVPTVRRVPSIPVAENPRPALSYLRSLLFIFALVRRHMTRATLRAVVITLTGPHVSPLMAARRATIKVAEALTFVFFMHGHCPFLTRESSARYERHGSW